MMETSSDALRTAKAMIQRHGMRAGAAAAEHMQEMRASGDTAGLERWQAVCAAIAELRQDTHDAAQQH